MASRIVEFFGFDPTDMSAAAKEARETRTCPFINARCTKTLSDGSVSGVCTLKPATAGPVICCPIRLYAEDYKILTDVAVVAFGENVELHPGATVKDVPVTPGKSRIAVFGKRWGKELRLPNRNKAKSGNKTGAYFVDWVLAKIDDAGTLTEFVAIEVQSIDTTGNYQAERLAHLNEEAFPGSSTAGFNWENVSKRILPQIIYKGHVLRRERLCKHGLFFVCPTPVYDRIRERLGGNLYSYTLQTGALSLMWYDVGEAVAPGETRKLLLQGTFTTTVDQVANAFTSPSNLPEQNVYEAAIQAQLSI
ncbi:NotI family restriction endonuclease [Pseudomonas capeferrum]